MQKEQRFTMMSPSSGFAGRVMAQIEERERAQSRRRALFGTSLLVAAALALFALVGLWTASWVSVLLASPSAVFAALATVSPMLDDLLDALWLAALVILQNVNGVMLLAYASFVLALTVIWARVVTGTFQRPSTVSLGGR